MDRKVKVKSYAMSRVEIGDGGVHVVLIDGRQCRQRRRPHDDDDDDDGHG